MQDSSPVLIPELRVTNFQKSLNFYVELAQFKVLYDRPEQEFAMLVREGAHIMIESSMQGNRVFDTGETTYPFGRGMHLQIKVSDIQELYRSFKKHNYPLFLDIEERWYRRNTQEMGNRQFMVQDPDGYLLRFYQDLGTRSFKS